MPTAYYSALNSDQKREIETLMCLVSAGRGFTIESTPSSVSIRQDDGEGWFWVLSDQGIDTVKDPPQQGLTRAAFEAVDAIVATLQAVLLQT